MWVMVPIPCKFENSIRVRSATPDERLDIIRVIKDENRAASTRYQLRRELSYVHPGLMPDYRAQSWRGHGVSRGDRRGEELEDWEDDGWMGDWHEGRDMDERREVRHVQGIRWSLADMSWWYDEDYRANGRQPSSTPAFRDTSVKFIDESRINVRAREEWRYEQARGEDIYGQRHTPSRDTDMRPMRDQAKRQHSPSYRRVESTRDSERSMASARAIPSSTGDYDNWARGEGKRLSKERQVREEFQEKITKRGKMITLEPRSPPPYSAYHRVSSVVVDVTAKRKCVSFTPKSAVRQ